jgi:hypothetical protein
MGLRERREKRQDGRETFGSGGSARRFQMRQMTVSIGNDYWIENEAGERVSRVGGKAGRGRSEVSMCRCGRTPHPSA